RVAAVVVGLTSSAVVGRHIEPGCCGVVSLPGGPVVHPAGSTAGMCPSWARMVMLSQVTHHSANRLSRRWATPAKVNLVLLPFAGNGPRSPSWVPSYVAQNPA